MDKVDKTGLPSTYTFQLDWTPDIGEGGSPGLARPDVAPPDSNGPSLFAALQEQVGLRLQSTKGAVESLVIEEDGVPYLTASTDSTDFPVQNPLQSANAGGMDAFVVKLNSTLSALTFGTYLGGSSNDGGNAIAADFETSIIVAGQTSSADFPTAASLQRYLSEGLSSFITKIAPNFMTGVSHGLAGQQGHHR